jgi:serine/threonine protein kinase
MMQYMPLGSAGTVDGEGFCYPQRCPGTVLVMLQSALAGLSYLHNQGIVHGAIKPENLMLVDDTCVALTDVIMARLGCHPSPFFTAPESLEAASPYTPTFEADVWALGVSFYALLFGSVPSRDVSTSGVGTLPYPRRTPKLLKDALCAMLVVNAKDRMTPQQLLKCVGGDSAFPLPDEAMADSMSLNHGSSFSSVGSGSHRSRRSVSFV